MVDRQKSDIDKLFSRKVSDISTISDESLFMINKYMSRWFKNIDTCLKVSQMFYYVDKQVLKFYMASKMEYPKVDFIVPSDMIRDDKYSQIKKYFQDYYKWSNRELLQNWSVISIQFKNKKFTDWMFLTFGLEKKELQLLGVENVAI
jgi:hypothetical protein